MLLLIAAIQVATDGPLDLVCFGGGTANKFAVTNVYGSHSGSGAVGTTPFSYGGSGSATAYSKRQQGFQDQVDVSLFAGDDRIRMPRTMLPPIRGGKDGWFKLKNVIADARTIRASIAVNFINTPKLFIDRTTGSITISGKAGDFAGECQARPHDAPAKF